MALSCEINQLTIYDVVLDLLKREDIVEDLSEGVHIECFSLVELLPLVLLGDCWDSDVVIGKKVCFCCHYYISNILHRLLTALNCPLSLVKNPLEEPKSINLALPD